MDIRKRLGNNIKRLAAERKISLEKLAYENDISKGYLYDLASGKGNASVLMLEKLAKALKVKAKDLID